MSLPQIDTVMFVGAKIVRVCGGFTHFLSHRVKFFSAGSWDGGAKMRSTGPIWYWLFCSSDCRTSSTPVSWWCLSPRLGFASWRSLNYFAVARHLYSSSGGVLHSTEQDESFRFDYFSHLSGGLRLRLRPPATPESLPFRQLDMCGLRASYLRVGGDAAGGDEKEVMRWHNLFLWWGCVIFLMVGRGWEGCWG